MELFWHWIADYLPKGDVGKAEDWEIATAVHWQGEPSELVEGLAAEAWIDPHPKHRFVVHDWPEHCEESVHTKLARAREFFADGSKPRLGKLGGADREAAEKYYAKSIMQPVENSLQGFTVEETAKPEQISLWKSSQPTEKETDSTRGHERSSNGPQKDLASPGLASPRLALFERTNERKTSEQDGSIETDARSLDSIAEILNNATGGALGFPDSEICRQVQLAMNGRTIEDLAGFLKRLNIKKIRSYGFFPKAIAKGFIAPLPKPAPAPRPEVEVSGVTVELEAEYLTWRLQEAERIYSETHSDLSKLLKDKLLQLKKQYPSIALQAASEGKRLARTAVLSDLIASGIVEIPSLAHYRAVVRPKSESASTYVEKETEAGSHESASGIVVLGGMQGA